MVSQLETNTLFTMFVNISTTSDFVLRAAPHISEQYSEIASKIRVAFTGDPSFFAYNGEEEEPEPEDPDAPPVERFREVHRLTYIVKVMSLAVENERLYISVIARCRLNIPKVSPSPVFY